MKGFIFFIFSIVASNLYSQSNQEMNDPRKEVLTVVEQMPEYPGGMNALYTHLYKHIEYPDSAKKK